MHDNILVIHKEIIMRSHKSLRVCKYCMRGFPGSSFGAFEVLPVYVTPECYFEISSNWLPRVC